MSENDLVSNRVNVEAQRHKDASGCYISMLQTAENVANEFKVERKRQDEVSFLSHKKAHAATLAGKFKEEIVPLTVELVDKKSGRRSPFTVTKVF